MLRKSFTFLLLPLLILATVVTFNAQIKPQVKPQAKKRPASRNPKGIVTVSIATATTPEQKRRLEAFNTVWQTIRENYFDQTFNGLDWDAIRKEYEPKVLRSTDSLQFHSLLQEMINRLDRSHFVIIPPDAYEELEKAKVQVKENSPDSDDEEDAGNDGEEEDSGKDEPGSFLLDDSESEFGVGIDIRMIGAQIVITSVEKGSSAEKAGLKAGYVIDKVNGVSLKTLFRTFAVSGAYGKLAEKMFPMEVLNYFINGEDESLVLISFLDEKDAVREVSVKREKLNGKMIKAVPNFPKEFFSFESRSLNADTGYIKFNMFAMASVEGMCRALSEFKDKKAVIIDMRGNVGGSIGALIGITAMLIDKPVNLGTQIYKHSREVVSVRPQGRKYNGRLIVLIDSMSYSAAEIFAGGLQESGRLTVVGEKSAGQALPATTIQLATGALFMYPFANFLTPKGYAIEGKGVIPDVSIPRERISLLAGKDTQLDTAVALSAKEPVKLSARDKIATGKMDLPKISALKRPSGFVVADKAPKPKLEPKYDEAALKVIGDFISATGGEDEWKKLQSYSAKGAVELKRVGAKIDGAIEILSRAPNLNAELMEIDSVGGVRGFFDGKTYTVQSDIMGNSDDADEKQIREMVLFHDIHEVLKIKQLYRQVTYVGEYPRQGKLVTMIRAVTEDGLETAFTFDVKTKLLVSRAGGSASIFYDDYRKVGNIMLPFLQTRSDSLIIKFTEYKLNVPLEDSIFIPKDNCFTVQDKSVKEEK